MDTSTHVIIRHSASLRDAALVKEFLLHLAPVRLFRGVIVWTEEDIEPGSVKHGEIEQAIRAARVAILFLTPEFLASEHVERVEIPLLRVRHASRDLAVVPCLVRSCLWDIHPWLSTLQMLPRNKQPLDSLPDHQRTHAMTEVVRDILRLARPHDQTAAVFRRERRTRDELLTTLSTSNAVLSCFAAIALHAIDAFKVVATVWIIASVIVAIAVELLRRSEVASDKRPPTDASSRFSWLMFAVAISGSITAYAAPTYLPPPIHEQKAPANGGSAVSRGMTDAASDIDEQAHPDTGVSNTTVSTTTASSRPEAPPKRPVGKPCETLLTPVVHGCKKKLSVGAYNYWIALHLDAGVYTKFSISPKLGIGSFQDCVLKGALSRYQRMKSSWRGSSECSVGGTIVNQPEEIKEEPQ